MSKKEYLDLLRYYLRKLPDNVVEDIIADYEEHFRIGMAEGKSEGIISAELGSPIEIARDFKASEYSFDREEQANASPKKTSVGEVILWILFIVILGPFALAAIIVVASIVFAALASFLAVIFSLFVLGGGLLIDLLGLNIDGLYVGLNLSPLTQALSGITSIFLGLLCVPLAYYAVKYLWLGLKKLVLGIRWEYRKRRAKK